MGQQKILLGPWIETNQRGEKEKREGNREKGRGLSKAGGEKMSSEG